MSTISSWNGPKELHLLNHQINQMIAHGIYLLHFDAEKGKVCLLLGLELKDDLKQFFEHSPQNLTAFKKEFLLKLHSKDKEMSVHRAEWKIITTNIAIALTGFGLIALGIYYALHKQCFFASTKRESLINKISQNDWLSMPTR